LGASDFRPTGEELPAAFLPMNPSLKNIPAPVNDDGKLEARARRDMSGGVIW